MIHNNISSKESMVIRYKDAFDEEEDSCYEDEICSISLEEDIAFDDSDYEDDTGFDEEEVSSPESKKSIADTMIQAEIKLKEEKIKEEYEKTKHIPINDTEEEKILAKKLCWLEKEIKNYPREEELDEKEYPEIKSPKIILTKKEKNNFNPKNILQNHIKIFVSSIAPTNIITFGFPPIKEKPKFKNNNIICKYILEKKECPFGDDCHFNHSEKILCKFIAEGQVCKHLKCRFFHPEEKPKQTLKNKKFWFCKNLFQTGKCKFGENCIFAHSEEEVKRQSTECKFGMRCFAVSRFNNQYINIGPKKCLHLHKNENIRNLIMRMQ